MAQLTPTAVVDTRFRQRRNGLDHSWNSFGHGGPSPSAPRSSWRASGFPSSELARFLGGPSGGLTGTPNQQFVEQAYLDMLGRIADANGLAAWSGLLDQGQATRPGRA